MAGGKRGASGGENLSFRKPAVLAVTIAALLLAVWYWPSSEVALDENGYEVTIALYRVCNQRNEKGLDEIEAALNRTIAPDDGLSEQQAAIQSIIQDAREGRWDAAATECRQLLEDQVDRP